ncbi:hypothetical protein NIES4072_40060 [Nostoc commune NIES-4072]|uniref:Uncharacterized protein n=1 Tax=Nostoc commune NIES-4072 TaxID=2005467 RepID=A0A2R5FQK8_NOSCO|nr:hypothetical protein NIES4070_50710 [Nostoc commune HK-02]GBG20329.1 hypothetical protein NIES4072_40060 [Nostoc commune NIES-4072]
MIIAGLTYQELEPALEANIVGGQSAPPAVFQGTSSGVTTVANFNPNGSATLANSNSFSSLTGSFPSFDVNFGTSTTTQSIPTFPR